MHQLASSLLPHYHVKFECLTVYIFTAKLVNSEAMQNRLIIQNPPEMVSSRFYVYLD